MALSCIHGGMGRGEWWWWPAAPRRWVSGATEPLVGGPSCDRNVPPAAHALGFDRILWRRADVRDDGQRSRRLRLRRQSRWCVEAQGERDDLRGAPPSEVARWEEVEPVVAHSVVRYLRARSGGGGGRDGPARRPAPVYAGLRLPALSSAVLSGPQQA